MITPNANTRQVYLPAGSWIDFWSNARHTGGQNIQWNNTDQSQFPLFVREGAVVPMLLGDVRTLCDANYVNDPQVSTSGTGLQLQVYPGGDSGFTMFDGTDVQSHGDSGSGRVTIASAARRLTVRILATEPASVRRDGAAMPRQQFSLTGAAGWQFNAAEGLIEIGFDHPGGTSTIEY